ncbi:MAG TPA: tRNA (adenosine(37)-N6)-threonylcarbamoyltransferase complex transferase subunit TsaD [Vicinamibacterales bacterium]|jgi:N6-L-threonylcarbamoyladenine synthase
MPATILGIETSCDETAASVVAETGEAEKPWAIRSSVVASQAPIHREWGGVVPELASRQHIRDICGVVERALEQGGVGLADLDAIAVTQGPGLVGSLLVGLSFAKSLAAACDLPLVPVHHLAGHIESLFLQHGPLPLPAIVLVVSGGHTNLYLVPEPGVYRPLSRTRDDAAGEAYDKVAKLLGLGYPGGPIIDKLAKQGDDHAIDFPVARITHADRNAPFDPGLLDFSFSGVKTAVLRYVKARTAGEASYTPGRRGTPWKEAEQPAAGTLSDREMADVCASFQRVVVEALLDRTFAAAVHHRVRSVGIAGGVSANSRLRADAQKRGEELGLPVFVPTISLSTDNAAMIAAAGLRRFTAGVRGDLDVNADPALALLPTTPSPSPSPDPGR